MQKLKAKQVCIVVSILLGVAPASLRAATEPSADKAVIENQQSASFRKSLNAVPLKLLDEDEEFSETAGVDLEPLQINALLQEKQGISSNFLTDAFIFPGGVAFDSALWKSDRSSRFAMIFDLYHKLVKHSTPLVIEEMLGPPDAHRQIKDVSILSFHVPLRDRYLASLDFNFRDDRLLFLSLSQSSSDFPCNTTVWQKTNISGEKLAEIYNQRYFIIGLPVSVLFDVLPLLPSDPRFAGKVTETFDDSDGRTHRIGPFIFEYSPDKKTVSRFRIAYRDKHGVVNYTDWESVDLRKDPRCLMRFSDYRMISPVVRSHILTQPFNHEVWVRADFSSLAFRGIMIENLLANHALIGMSRHELYELLGPSANHAQKQLSPASRDGHWPYMHSQQTISDDPLCADTEIYLVSLRSQWLEFAIKDEHVAAFRILDDRCSGCLGDIEKIQSGRFADFEH